MQPTKRQRLMESPRLYLLEMGSASDKLLYAAGVAGRWTVDILRKRPRSRLLAGAPPARARTAEKPRLKSNVVWQRVGSEFVVFSRATRRSRLLDGLSARMLMLCDGDRSEGEIIEAVAEEFSAPASSVAPRVRSTLSELAEFQYITSR